MDQYGNASVDSGIVISSDRADLTNSSARTGEKSYIVFAFLQPAKAVTKARSSE